MEHQINDTNLQFWQQRYGEEQYAYGKTPNLFFKEWLGQLSPKTILMPADGEGRNGVYAATLGWKVTSFDLIAEGAAKAKELATANNVRLDYFIGSIEQMRFETESFEAIGLIYAHFPADKISAYHKTLSTYLKPGGMVILEAFGIDHLKFNTLNPKVGGPKNIDMLFSIQQLTTDFEGYDIAILEEREIELSEGLYHNGRGSVIRFVGIKPYP